MFLVNAPVLLALTAAPAAHPQRMVRAQDPQSLVSALQAAGYAADLGVDKVGDPVISSDHSGTRFQISFYNCTNHKECATIQFHAGYHLNTSVTLETMNNWNRTQRFGRGYLDQVNDPIVNMDVDLDDGGVSPALFIDNLDVWTSILTRFEQAIGYRNVSPASSAATWVPAGRNTQGATFEVDRDSVRRNNNVVTYTVRVRFSAAVPSTGTDSYIAIRRADCNDLSYRDLHTDYYKGGVITSTSGEEETRQAPAQSVVGYVTVLACGLNTSSK